MVLDSTESVISPLKFNFVWNLYQFFRSMHHYIFICSWHSILKQLSSCIMVNHIFCLLRFCAFGTKLCDITNHISLMLFALKLFIETKLVDALYLSNFVTIISAFWLFLYLPIINVTLKKSYYRYTFFSMKLSLLQRVFCFACPYILQWCFWPL